MRTVDENTRARLALLALPRIGPARARWLLGSHEPASLLATLRKGKLPSNVDNPPAGVNLRLISEWAQAARAIDVDQLVAAQTQGANRILSPADADWPFHDEPEPPVLLFYSGELELLRSEVTVAVVGTRRCTSVGRAVAYKLGSELANRGVGVISGLALGIDGAAHKGCLDQGGAVIGVVGTGLDVVYPGANRRLWADVAGNGLLLSEALAGTKPQRWRFPARNRLIASLCTALVVVESHERGGSLLTVDECLDRDRMVFAVPGSVTSPASDGVNRLLVDGAPPVRDAQDILGYLGFNQQRPISNLLAVSEPVATWSEITTDVGQLILDETAAGSVHLDRLVQAANASAAEIIVEVQRLVSAGLVELDGSTVYRKSFE